TSGRAVTAESPRLVEPVETRTGSPMGASLPTARTPDSGEPPATGSVAAGSTSGTGVTAGATPVAELVEAGAGLSVAVSTSSPSGELVRVDTGAESGASPLSTIGVVSCVSASRAS